MAAAVVVATAVAVATAIDEIRLSFRHRFIPTQPTAGAERQGCEAPALSGTLRVLCRAPDGAMRVLPAFVVLSIGVAGCTPYIPVKDDFGTSALVLPAAPSLAVRGAHASDVPPEFAEFNAYDPAVNRLLATQICATPYQPLEEKPLGAASGGLLQARGRCQTHIPIFGE